MRKTTAKSLTMMLTKSSDKLFKIISINFVVIIKDIETDYDFYNWHYVITKTQLSNKTTLKLIYLNTECLVISFNCMFFKSQYTKVKIHIIIMLILIQEINFNKHITNKYIIVSIYLADIVKSN